MLNRIYIKINIQNINKNAQIYDTRIYIIERYFQLSTFNFQLSAAGYPIIEYCKKIKTELLIIFIYSQKNGKKL